MHSSLTMRLVAARWGKHWEYLDMAVKISKKIALTLLHIHTATLLSEADVSAFKLFFLEKRIFKYFRGCFLPVNRCLRQAREQLNAFVCLSPFTCDFFTFLYHFVVIWSPVTFYYILRGFATETHFLWDLPRAFQNVCVYTFYYTFEIFWWLCVTWACHFLCPLWKHFCLLCWIRLNKVVSFKLYTLIF